MSLTYIIVSSSPDVAPDFPEKWNVRVNGNVCGEYRSRAVAEFVADRIARACVASGDHTYIGVTPGKGFYLFQEWADRAPAENDSEAPSDFLTQA